MHAQRPRVVIALTSFLIVVSAFCMAQTQGVTDPNPSARGHVRSARGRVMSPASSIAHSGDKGVRAHTHLQVFVPEETITPSAGPPFSGLGFETPASLACVYSLVPRTSACNPNFFTPNPTASFRPNAILPASHSPPHWTD